MEKEYPYVTVLDVRHKHLERIDVNDIVAKNPHKWYNETLTKVNDSVVRIGIVEGEYHWHKHDHDDEFFFILEGKLIIDMEDRTIEFGPSVEDEMCILGLGYYPRRLGMLDGNVFCFNGNVFSCPSA